MLAVLGLKLAWAAFYFPIHGGERCAVVVWLQEYRTEATSAGVSAKITALPGRPTHKAGVSENSLDHILAFVRDKSDLSRSKKGIIFKFEQIAHLKDTQFHIGDILSVKVHQADEARYRADISKFRPSFEQLMLRLSGPITVIAYVMADESNARWKEDALFEGEGEILSSTNLELAAKIRDKRPS